MLQFYFVLQYAVVRFLPTSDEDVETVEVVSSNWILEGDEECYWPPKNSKIPASRLALMKVKPDTSSWVKLPIVWEHGYSMDIFVVSQLNLLSN